MTDTAELLQSQPFRRAVSRIQLRAEKQTNWDKVTDVFVKSDLRDRVESPDHQLILGRRGTGKTHLLRVFQKDSLASGEPAIYFDMTRLGSGLSGLHLSPVEIARKYFHAFLTQLGSELLELVTAMENPDGGVQDEVFEHLAGGLPTAAGPDFQINYGEVTNKITNMLKGLGILRLYIIADEWATIPFEVQPFLADQIKRGILTIPEVSAKILAVNYQCQFSKTIGGDVLGLTKGADLPSVIDMDRYFVFDEYRDFVVPFFAKLLYNHLGVELGWNLASDENRKKQEILALFTQERAFLELVRSAEGNCRDLLCIFSRAYFDEYRHSDASNVLSIPNVVSAAASWFDQEKALNIYAEKVAAETLTFIIENVLRGYKSRTFLVEESNIEHPRITRLLNERVLHRVGGTYSHQDRPGLRYCSLTVDYGAFVKLRGTVYQVQEDVWMDTESLDAQERETAVPVDDKRSIRRIVFDPHQMEVKLDKQLRFRW